MTPHTPASVRQRGRPAPVPRRRRRQPPCFPLLRSRRTFDAVCGRWGRVGQALGRQATGDDRGQATSEYGLVILAAGGIALGVIAWAGKTGVFTGLFESVVDSLTSGL